MYFVYLIPIMTDESKSKEKEFVSEEIKIKDKVHELQVAEHEEEKES